MPAIASARLRIALLLFLLLASAGGGVVAEELPHPGVSAHFAATPNQVWTAAEHALRDGRYTVHEQQKDRLLTGSLRRATPAMAEQAQAIEELRRLSRFDPVQIPDTRGLAEYRITLVVELTKLSEDQTGVRIESKILTLSRVPKEAPMSPTVTAFPSLGVAEEELIQRMREHLGSAAIR
jgi:hypothetical protein